MKTNGQAIPKRRILTLANLLTLMRILYIPLFTVAYVEQENHQLAAWIYLLSGLTDIVDGPLARRTQTVSDLGKILDPIADKLTQLTVLLCLCVHYPTLRLLIPALIVKEGVCGVLGLWAIRRSARVDSSLWHGKVVGVLLFLTLLFHLIAPLEPLPSRVLCAACLFGMVFSFFMYFRKHLQTVKEARR